MVKLPAECGFGGLEYALFGGPGGIAWCEAVSFCGGALRFTSIWFQCSEA